MEWLVFITILAYGRYRENQCLPRLPGCITRCWRRKGNGPIQRGQGCVMSSQNDHPINSCCLDTSNFQEWSPLSNYFCFAWISRCLQTSGPEPSGELNGPHQRTLWLTTPKLNFQEFMMCTGYNWFHLRYFRQNYPYQFSEILALNYFIYISSFLKCLHNILYWLQMPTVEDEHIYSYIYIWYVVTTVEHIKIF